MGGLILDWLFPPKNGEVMRREVERNVREQQVTSFTSKRVRRDLILTEKILDEAEEYAARHAIPMMNGHKL